MAVAFQPNKPVWVTTLGLALTAVGYALGVVGLVALGRSFSLFPEARRLVMHGPYRLVRHPLYLAELVATLGVAVVLFRPEAFLLYAAHVTCQIWRICLEERLLEKTFPEYARYKIRTPFALIPWVF